MLQGLFRAHQEFKTTLGDAEAEFKEIIGLMKEVQRISQEFSVMLDMDNPYTTISIEVCTP